MYFSVHQDFTFDWTWKERNEKDLLLIAHFFSSNSILWLMAWHRGKVLGSVKEVQIFLHSNMFLLQASFGVSLIILY